MPITELVGSFCKSESFCKGKLCESYVPQVKCLKNTFPKCYHVTLLMIRFVHTCDTSVQKLPLCVRTVAVHLHKIKTSQRETVPHIALHALLQHKRILF